MKRRSLTAFLGDSPRARSAAYLGLMVVIIEAANQYVRTRTDPHANIHTPALPFVIACTYAFAQLGDNDRAAWHHRPTPRDLQQLGVGLLAGSTAITSVLGIAAAKGWVSAPAWGWQNVPADQVAHSVALLLLNQVATAWNEEQVFRGYGLDTLRQAIGLPAAIVILVGLFALFHGLDVQRLFSLALAGVLLTLLRFESGGLWLPFGFHLAWNIWQTAVFGPSDEASSIRPLLTHGPAAWIGVPGEPEPGLLATIIVALLVSFMALRLWYRKRQSA